MMPPQEQVARDFMAHKGYSLARPVRVDKLEDLPCWYYVYRLPDGVLELEVSWDGSQWHTLVTSFVDQDCGGCMCVLEHDGDHGSADHASPCPPHTCRIRA